MIWDAWWIVAQVFFVRVVGPILSGFTEVEEAGLEAGLEKGIERTLVLLTVGGWLLSIALAVAMIMLVLRALEKFRRAPA